MYALLIIVPCLVLPKRVPDLLHRLPHNGPGRAIVELDVEDISIQSIRRGPGDGERGLVVFRGHLVSAVQIVAYDIREDRIFQEELEPEPPPEHLADKRR